MALTTNSDKSDPNVGRPANPNDAHTASTVRGAQNSQTEALNRNAQRVSEQPATAEAQAAFANQPKVSYAVEERGDGSVAFVVEPDGNSRVVNRDHLSRNPIPTTHDRMADRAGR